MPAINRGTSHSVGSWLSPCTHPPTVCPTCPTCPTYRDTFNTTTNRMNYLAHGCRFLDSPYFVAGTAVPDWLSVIDRKVRVRGHAAETLLADEDFATRQLAAGILRHLADDRWFHQTRAFAETSLRFAVELRQRLPDDEGFRPSFLGHILVEILIDATLMERDPGLAADYYQTLGGVSATHVQDVVNRIARIPSNHHVPSNHRVPTNHLAVGIARFLEVRFLYDYLDDARLLFRLEQIMRRVGLPPLGEHLLSWLPAARAVVAQRCDELLTPPAATPVADPSPPT